MTGLLHAALLGLALAYAGMASLCFAMDRHYGQLTARHAVPWPQRALLRLGGAVLLIGASWPCLRGFGVSVGAVVWLGVLSVGALMLTLALQAAPRVAASVAVLSALSAGWALR